jgi:radical SAM-linked protein
MRSWERILRRAEIALAYSQGFTPHPRISLAAPLPLGVTSEAELMDIFLTKRVSTYFFLKTISPQLPRGIDILEVQEVPLDTPSLQSRLRAAEYRMEVKTEENLAEIQQAIISLLQAEHLPWQHMRDTGPRHYDLRALIEDIWLIDWRDIGCILGMRLRSDPQGSGRPEQIIAALGFSDYPTSIHRTKLILAGRKGGEAYPGKTRRALLERRRVSPRL